jgi:hypothetical protein
LLPYVAISYYERYAVPLLAVKVLLVLWAVDSLWNNQAGVHFQERGHFFAKKTFGKAAGGHYI